MKYIYGPLTSRRLGVSLGINLTAPKTCNFDCVYCQLGPTERAKINLRKEYVPVRDILDELGLWLRENSAEAAKINYITLSGSGEPTLNLHIGELILGIRQLCAIPVAVITNSSLLNEEAVRRQIETADLIVPSLDAVTQEVFARINRPTEGIEAANIIAGLIELRREYKRKIWLEVMLVRGVNDDLRHIKKLKTVIDQVRPDKIQLNSPVRATAVAGIAPIERKKLEKIKEILGERCEII